ncbi:DUF5315 domain-containing protein [Aspergillus mulundensis]|uniref:Uncharacterized protein n=1 Tax=Aspergillus mulundensis TaxID=1810919 RepID=A0A3D8RQQ1_9EURO|nr:Uncharacterized protein DSM5745_06258 [Aspergillus mulundensis]RDW76266.1 Uncharacterized protein DSM5745_06258 [Aspergillus mulundensis]
MDNNFTPDALRKVSSQRLPPPALFQGPPSHNASNLSLQPPVPTVAAPGGGQPPSQVPLLHRRRSSPKPLDASGLSPFLSRTQSRGEVDGSDALWEEMQSALSDVEVSAAVRGHVFGERHSEALEDLRMKHLRLAQAWGRDETEDGSAGSNVAMAEPPPLRRDSRAAGDTSGEMDESAKRLDEETEKDIQLARQRREANDRYFDRVNNSVLDVVAKLEDIAQAMRTMEAESKDIWSEDDSLSTATKSTVHTAG